MIAEKDLLKFARERKHRKRWVFGVGGWLERKVTVIAPDYEETCFKASETLDKRNPDGPVHWDLTLLKMELVPK